MADEPMTDERLSEIRARAEAIRDWLLTPESDNMPHFPTSRRILGVDALALLAEVERLRAREAAAMAIVRAVADGATTYRDREDEYCTQDPNCMWREERPGGPSRMIHTDRCIVTKACVLLAEE